MPHLKFPYYFHLLHSIVCSSTPLCFWINKIKELFPFVLLWLVHMSVLTTPLFWSFTECAVISNKENRTSVPEEFEWTSVPEEFEWTPKPGRPAYIFHQIGQGNFLGIECTEPARLQKGHGDWPQVQAGRSILGHPAPLVSLSLRAFAWCWFEPSTSLSFLLSFEFTLIKLK